MLMDEHAMVKKILMQNIIFMYFLVCLQILMNALWERTDAVKAVLIPLAVTHAAAILDTPSAVMDTPVMVRS